MPKSRIIMNHKAHTAKAEALPEAPEMINIDTGVVTYKDGSTRQLDPVQSEIISLACTRKLDRARYERDHARGAELNRSELNNVLTLLGIMFMPIFAVIILLFK